MSRENAFRRKRTYVEMAEEREEGGRRRKRRRTGMNKELEESLKKPLEASNKGFQLLVKMGYTPGRPLGKDLEESNNGGSSGMRSMRTPKEDPRIEPIEIKIKNNRCGLGRDQEKRKRKRKRRGNRDAGNDYQSGEESRDRLPAGVPGIQWQKAETLNPIVDERDLHAMDRSQRPAANGLSSKNPFRSNAAAAASVEKRPDRTASSSEVNANQRLRGQTEMKRESREASHSLHKNPFRAGTSAEGKRAAPVDIKKPVTDRGRPAVVADMKRPDADKRRTEGDTRRLEEDRRRSELDAKRADEDRKRSEVDIRRLDEDVRRPDATNRRLDEDKNRLQLDARRPNDGRRPESDAPRIEVDRRRLELENKRTDEDRRHAALDIANRSDDRRRPAVDFTRSEVERKNSDLELRKTTADERNRSAVRRSRSRNSSLDISATSHSPQKNPFRSQVEICTKAIAAAPSLVAVSCTRSSRSVSSHQREPRLDRTRGERPPSPSRSRSRPLRRPDATRRSLSRGSSSSQCDERTRYRTNHRTAELRSRSRSKSVSRKATASRSRSRIQSSVAAYGKDEPSSSLSSAKNPFRSKAEMDALQLDLSSDEQSEILGKEDDRQRVGRSSEHFSRTQLRRMRRKNSVLRKSHKSAVSHSEQEANVTSTTSENGLELARSAGRGHGEQTAARGRSPPLIAVIGREGRQHTMSDNMMRHCKEHVTRFITTLGPDMNGERCCEQRDGLIEVQCPSQAVYGQLKKAVGIIPAFDNFKFTFCDAPKLERVAFWCPGQSRRSREVLEILHKNNSDLSTRQWRVISSRAKKDTERREGTSFVIAVDSKSLDTLKRKYDMRPYFQSDRVWFSHVR